MNLYLRLLWLLWRLRSVQRRGLFEESRVAFCVWPNDCDLNLHMNSGRYPTLMDLGRVHLTAQSGLAARGAAPALDAGAGRGRYHLHPVAETVRAV